jgi:beta-galactosidase
MKKHTLENQNFLLGVDYYPEHWLPSQWPQDAQVDARPGARRHPAGRVLLGQTGARRGRFEWDWLDESIRTWLMRD